MRLILIIVILSLFSGCASFRGGIGKALESVLYISPANADGIQDELVFLPETFISDEKIKVGGYLLNIFDEKGTLVRAVGVERQARKSKLFPNLRRRVSEKVMPESLVWDGKSEAGAFVNGQILRDLVLGEETELTELFFVNRFVVPFPTEPLRYPVGHTIRAALALQDRWQERKL